MATRTLSKPVKKRSERHAKMTVVKRNGSVQPLSFDKIAHRIAKLCYNLSDLVDADEVSKQVIAGLVSGITTSEIDQQAAKVAAELTNVHHDYSVLAARLLVADLHRTTTKSFSENAEKMAAYINPKTGEPAPLISEMSLEMTRKHAQQIDATIVHNRDNNFTYFGLKTLMRSYLLKMNGEFAESPQHMYMRVAIGVRPDNIEAALELYTMLSRGYISMASPTMFNAGTRKNQMSSCFLLHMHGDGDSIDSFFETLWSCAKISKTAGGIGLSLHNVRARGSYIAGTNGTSNGLIPLLRVFNDTARYVDQGGNKRPGAFAMYLEPWHADVFPFLDLRKPTGQPEVRCRDLFIALWIPDLFMRRVESGGDWTLMCPKECPGLADVYGQEFEDLYTKYEREGKGRKTIPARKLWDAILLAQTESGSPYMLYKDSVNRKSGQMNLGTIKCSNLCVAADTFILTSKGERMIGGIADSHEVSKQATQLAEEKKDAETQLADANTRLKKLKKNKKAGGDPSHKAAVERWEGVRSAMKARLEKLKDIDDNPQPKTQEKVDVWNGKKWSTVTPVKTADKAPLWRVTTSHGSILECTPDHKWILEDGTRVPTKELHIGSRLIRTPPVEYEGNPTHEQRPATAFRRGFTYAYGLMRMGGNPETLGPNAAIKVGGLVVPKENVTKETLEKLGYDAKAMLQQAPGKDHQTLAFMQLPEDERQGLQDRLCGPLETRKAWVQGFMAAANGKLDEIKGPHRFLRRVRMMFRSVGEDARLRRLTKQGVWQLHWPEKRDDAEDAPVVIAIENLGVEEATYCFTEPEEHAGVFEDQLTGQCTEIVEHTSPDEEAVCLTGDTLIQTKTGLKRLEECHGAEVLVPNISDVDSTRKPRHIAASLIDNGEKPVYKIITSGGSIKATDNHKFLVKEAKDQFSWKQLSEIVAGDSISAPVIKAPGFDKPLVFDVEYGTVGWIVGDGWQRKDVYGTCFGPVDVMAQEVVIPVLNKWKVDAPTHPLGHHHGDTEEPYTQPNGVVCWASSKKGFIAYIQQRFGLMPHKSITKVIPDSILCSENPQHIASFISGLFSADGCVQQPKEKAAHISYSSSSREMLEQLCVLLRPFGIKASLVWSHPKGRNPQGKIDIFGHGVVAFADHIGFALSKEKQAKLDAAVAAFKANAWHFSMREYLNVKAIEAAGTERVYDLNVPGAHHFVANGLVTHNCNLSSISLKKFVILADPDDPDATPRYDFAKLHDVVRRICAPALNSVIDLNFYPTERARQSNMKHRPVGIGVQGLADTFALMRYPWEVDDMEAPLKPDGTRRTKPNPAAKLLNQQIFETIYHAALSSSCDKAKADGKTYESYPGSPASKGILQYDMWGVTPTDLWDWAALKARIAEHGLANSLMVAPMPTASTAQILGNNEAFEPFTNNVMTRKVLAGEFQVVNKYLQEDLIAEGLWSDDMREEIIAADGSVQETDPRRAPLIARIPNAIKALYKTVWEISQKTLIDMAADRGAFIDQSQSFNVHIAEPDFAKLTSMHFYGWKKGLKTGMYYLRTREAVGAEKVVTKISHKDVEPVAAAAAPAPEPTEEEILACSLANPGACDMCGA